jgi:hypothetical protein
MSRNWTAPNRAGVAGRRARLVTRLGSQRPVRAFKIGRDRSCTSTSIAIPCFRFVLTVRSSKRAWCASLCRQAPRTGLRYTGRLLTATPGQILTRNNISRPTSAIITVVGGAADCLSAGRQPDQARIAMFVNGRGPLRSRFSEPRIGDTNHACGSRPGRSLRASHRQARQCRCR